MEDIYGIWPEWNVVQKIGQGSFGSVYEIERNDFGNVMHSALKVLSVPQNPGDVEALVSEGMSGAEIRDYYSSVVLDLVEEFKLMAELRGHTNIVSYEDHKVVEHPDGIGCDILIRMELLTPFYTYLKMHGNDIYQSDVLKLGIDICRALEVCENYKIIHRDIKPENIFVNDRGDFKLGDFGVAREMDKTMSMMSKKGTYSYMAPEVFLGEEYDATVDIYSLGIVMYKYFNEGRLPFVERSGSVSSEYRQNAMMRRIKGEPLPPPSQADPDLAAVILKACAPRPADRFRTAAEFRRNLESILESGVSLLNMQGETYQRMTEVQTPAFARETGYRGYGAVQSVTEPVIPSAPPMPSPAPRTEPKKKSMAPLIVFLVLAIIGVMGIAGYLYWKGSKEEDEEGAGAVTDESTVTETVVTEEKKAATIAEDGSLVGENYSFKLLKQTISATIAPVDTSGEYTYYSPSEDKHVYIDLQFSVTHTGTKTYSWSSLMRLDSISPEMESTATWFISKGKSLTQCGSETAMPDGSEVVHFAVVVPESVMYTDNVKVKLILDGAGCIVNVE